MSEASGKIYIPPYSGVRLIECRDHFQLVPVPAVQVVYGYGKIKSREVTIDPDDKTSEPVWDDLAPDQEVWAAMQWFRFEDGNQVQGNICFLRPECTEEQVRKRMEEMERDSNITREQALAMLQCYDAPQEDHDSQLRSPWLGERARGRKERTGWNIPQTPRHTSSRPMMLKLPSARPRC